MKKLLLVLLLALIALCISSYIFIPSTLNISSAVTVGATDNGTQRFINDETNWTKWWNYHDSNSITKASIGSFIINGDVFRLTEKFYKSVKINIQHKKQQLGSTMVVIPLQQDSTSIQWNCSLPTSSNPFKRVMQYMEAKKIKNNIEQVLANLSLFLSKKENIYGIHIDRISIKDTLFVSTKSIFTTFPTTPDIYNLIQKTQLFAARKGAKQTGNPIFNITQIDNKHYQAMVAVPVDRTLSDNDVFSLKKMIKGSFIVTDVVGGDYTVNNASMNLQQYFDDYRKTSMAMKFTMLITDRMYQPDTTRWITRLYLPVY